ncbi:MAG: ABC transporter permease [Firmicutes bacterium]|nr:ABC transporter permease [Bacillota bacterium]
MRYILNKVAFFVVALWAALTINFILPRLMPGNPAMAMFAKFGGQLNPQALHALELEFGFSKQPMILQYLTYLKNMAEFHWGLSYTYYPTPVKTVIFHSLPWTIGLVGISTLFAVLIGTGFGIYIAWRRGGFLDNTLPVTTMFLQAMPYFWTATILLYVFAFVLHWFPLGHAYATTVTPGWNLPFIMSVLYHSVLPAVTIFLGSVSGWIVGMRNNMINTLGEDYVVFAEAKGVSSWRLMTQYAARNAILPQVTSFALAMGLIVSGSILTEEVFSYPGIGFQLTNAVLSQDLPLIQAAFLIIAVSVLVVNLLVDILYSRLDPRVRTGGGVQ